MKLILTEEEKKRILEQYLGKAPKKMENPMDFSGTLDDSLEDSIILIKKHEGFCDGTTKCPPHTVGYGTRTDLHPELKGKKINDVIATAYVKKDLENQIIPVIREVVKIPLNKQQTAALSSLIYNIGPSRFRQSELLKDLNSKNWEGVKKNWSEFRLSDGKVLGGLVKRRADEILKFFQNK